MYLLEAYLSEPDDFLWIENEIIKFGSTHVWDNASFRVLMWIENNL
jgi:hypothetical protein